MLRIFSDRPGPYVIGHRGAAGYAPENTFAAFERGLALQVDAIELDVHPTQDDELVVIHDPTLDRTTNGHGIVVEHTLAQIRELDAGAWFDPAFKGERVPIFKDVLAWARDRTRLVIEIKQGPIFYPRIAEQVVELLTAAKMFEQVMVISFDHFSVKQVKELQPKIATGVLYAGRCIDAVALARNAGADSLMPHWGLLTKEEVEAGHQANLFIAPWGEASQDYHMLVAAGVDALTADFPDRPWQALHHAGVR